MADFTTTTPELNFSVHTSIEKHEGAGMWHGTASAGDKKYQWYYRPRTLFHVTEAEPSIPGCWMNVKAFRKTVQMRTDALLQIATTREMQNAQWQEYVRLYGQLSNAAVPVALSYLRNLADRGAA
ncbi:MAG TPA: hypothetical protein VEN78_25005 [Bradyrhizobium sp.]|nr:hypothetical protein [Bradyrhizobium sp.]